MMKIGSFAKLCNVSIKTLRFYDTNGLLKPSYTDEQTGYRYYSEEQLLTVKRIKAFKQQGLSLQMIKQLLQTSKAAEAKTLLHQHKQNLEERLTWMNQSLHEVNAQLERIENWRAYESPKVAMIRETIPRSQLCLLLDELIQAAGNGSEDIHQVLMIIWYDIEERADGLCDVAVAMPLITNIPDHERVIVTELPGWELAASYIHLCNPYEKSCNAYQDLTDWLSAEGYHITPYNPVREIYLTSDKDMYGESRPAELLIPIQPSP